MALTEAREAGNERWMSSAVRQLGLVDYYAGRLRRAEERFGHALELARRAGDGRGAAWALEHLAWSATTRGDYAAAQAGAVRRVRTLRRARRHRRAGVVRRHRGLVQVLQGRLADGRATARALIPLAESLAENWGVAMCRTIDALGRRRARRRAMPPSTRPARDGGAHRERRQLGTLVRADRAGGGGARGGRAGRGAALLRGRARQR